MKIAIHARDLDSARIDGTRVYMRSVINELAKLAPKEEFVLYHGQNFNPQLAPEKKRNVMVKTLRNFLFWTQTLFALSLFKDRPDVLWMPMANIPLLRNKEMRTVVTIHDLAFKHFPQFFPKSDIRKLNMLSESAIKGADDIIAVSHATKDDILHFFPEVDEKKVHVVHHGFDAQLFQREIPAEVIKKVLESYQLATGKYLLYVGAIQPRKDLGVLIDAFELIKRLNSDLKLVIAGEKAWMWEDIVKKIENSVFKKDIVCTGSVPFHDLPVLYRNACAFVFPSLYEGFGIPVLEAFASNTPTVVARNSSLIEVAGNGADFFETGNVNELSKLLERILHDEQHCEDLVKKGASQLAKFSWKKCAQQTLDILQKKEYN